MTVPVIVGAEKAQGIAVMTEYDWQSDANNDPFAQYIDQGNFSEYLEVLGKA